MRASRTRVDESLEGSNPSSSARFARVREGLNPENSKALQGSAGLQPFDEVCLGYHLPQDLFIHTFFRVLNFECHFSLSFADAAIAQRIEQPFDERVSGEFDSH